MKFLTNIDLNKNQLLNAVIQVVAADPTGYVEGQIWYNSTDKVLKYVVGTENGLEIISVGKGDVTEEDFKELQEALGELESTVNDSTNGISAISNKASKAESDAASAKESAEQAITEASQAKSDASQAKSDASQANTAASEAKSIATTAAGDAATAKQSAASAIGKADDAINKANAAQTAADEAKTVANDAKTAASNAQTTAESKMDKVEVSYDGPADSYIAPVAVVNSDGSIGISSKCHVVLHDFINEGYVPIFKKYGDEYTSIGNGYTIVDNLEENSNGLVLGSTVVSYVDEKLAEISGGNIILDNYLQKLEAGNEGKIVTLDNNGGVVNSGYEFSTSIDSASENLDTIIPTADAITSYVTSYVNDSLATLESGVSFQGTVSSESNITVPYKAGDMYYINQSGIYFNNNCSVGDILIAIAERSEGQPVADEWTVLEGNKEVFNGSSDETNGTIGLVPAPPAGDTLLYLNNKAQWTPVVATRYSAANKQSDFIVNKNTGEAIWSINHNLGRMDVQVSVYNIIEEDNYEQIMCSVKLVGKNYCDIIINTTEEFIEDNKYFVVVM